MARDRRSASPTPLDQDLINGFHELIKNGSVRQAKKQLNLTPRLAYAKDELGFTSLMMVVLGDQTQVDVQVRIIDMLMRAGANLETRGPERCHVLLLACKRGVDPKLVDRILHWNRRRGRNKLRWSHFDSNKEGALVLAVRSGSLALVNHLFLREFDQKSEWWRCASNHPARVLSAAIETGDEELVLCVIGQDYLKDEFDDFHDSFDYDVNEESFPVKSVNVLNCVREAYEKRMFRAVCEMVPIDSLATREIWLCWRKSLRQKNPENVDNQTASVPPPSIMTIAKDFQASVVHRYNPTLLPLCVARVRYTATADRPFHVILGVPNCIFRNIAEYCFILDPEILQLKLVLEAFEVPSVNIGPIIAIVQKMNEQVP